VNTKFSDASRRDPPQPASEACRATRGCSVLPELNVEFDSPFLVYRKCLFLFITVTGVNDSISYLMTL